MTRSNAVNKPTGRPVLCIDPPLAPAWVDRVLGPSARTCAGSTFEGIRIESAETEELSFLRALVSGAGGLTEEEFCGSVERVYLRLAEELRFRSRFPLRFWNYVPKIGEASRDGFNRYEVFNSGRFAAYRSWYETDDFTPALVASSAVGHRGENFEVHLLAGVTPARAVGNPRQQHAYRYSRRHGEHPPSFARMTVLKKPLDAGYGPCSAIVSGTASIIGEDSQHDGNLDAQVRETLENLGRLSALFDGEGLNDQSRRLGRYREIRAYVVHDDDLSTVYEILERAFPNVAEIEVAAADICRPELLFEAEGIIASER